MGIKSFVRRLKSIYVDICLYYTNKPNVSNLAHLPHAPDAISGNLVIPPYWDRTSVFGNFFVKFNSRARGR